MIAALILQMCVATSPSWLPPLFVAFQQETYRERQVLDPDSDEWKDESPPPMDAASDALSQARLLLVEDEPGKAKSLLKDWVDENFEHERYYEGVYLLGEAYFEKRDFWKAYEYFQQVADSTAGSLFTKSLMRETDVARAFLSGQKRIVWKILRLPAYDDGVEILDRVWEQAPGTRVGETALKLKADYFYETGDMDLAQDEYVTLAREHPNGRYVQYAMLRAAESAEAAFPGVKFDDRSLVDADVRYHQVQQEFPGFAEREQVPARLDGIREQRAEKDLEIAKWYERTRRADAAEYYYRLVLSDWPGTLAAADAVTRLQAMGVDTGVQKADEENAG